MRPRGHGRGPSLQAVSYQLIGQVAVAPRHEAENHLKLLWSKAMVVSVEEKAWQKTVSGTSQGEIQVPAINRRCELCVNLWTIVSRRIPRIDRIHRRTLCNECGRRAGIRSSHFRYRLCSLCGMLHRQIAHLQPWSILHQGICNERR